MHELTISIQVPSHNDVAILTEQRVTVIEAIAVGGLQSVTQLLS